MDLENVEKVVRREWLSFRLPAALRNVTLTQKWENAEVMPQRQHFTRGF